MKLKTKLSKLRHDGYITDAEYAIIINVLNKFSTQPPKTQQKVEQPCEDAISREKLRKLICQNNDKYGYSDRFHEFTEQCLQLPPVTPSYNSIKTELKPSEDCISREEAIRVAEQGQIQGYEWQFKKLCNLPSVTPQPKIGKWIEIGIVMEGRKYKNHECDMADAYCCDYCGYNQYIKTNYCPNCGAKMEVEE